MPKLQSKMSSSTQRRLSAKKKTASARAESTYRPQPAPARESSIDRTKKFGKRYGKALTGKGKMTYESENKIAKKERAKDKKRIRRKHRDKRRQGDY